MKTVSNGLDESDIDSLHDLPLFASYCHSAKTEIKMPTHDYLRSKDPDEKMPLHDAVSLVDPTDASVSDTPSEANTIGQATPPQRKHVGRIDGAVPVINPGVGGPLTTASIKAAISSWTDLDLRKRRNWMSSVSRVERIIYAVEAERPPPEGIDRWSCSYLNDLLWAKPAAHAGIAESTLAATVSDLRQILLRLGRHADAGPRRNILAPEWAQLHGALPTPDRQRGLVRFLRFLTLEAISPKDVEPDILARFETWIRSQMLTENITTLTRKTASGWNWARANISGWPPVELQRPNMRDHYTVPIEAMSQPFQDDVRRFLDGLGGEILGNPYRHATTIQHANGKVNAAVTRQIRRGRAVSPETVRSRQQQIRRAVAALLKSGVPLEEIVSLQDLITPPDRPRTILQFHLDRLKTRVPDNPDLPEDEEPTSTHIVGMAELLRIIAVHHSPIPTPEIEEIKNLCAAVRMPPQSEMNETVGRKLRALNAPDTLAILLTTPAKWMRAAERPDLKPQVAATLAMQAIALEIALSVPLRRRNLVGLHRDRHLIRDLKTGKITGLHIPASATKTRRRPIIWEFPPRLSQLIDHYERRYLPDLAPAENRYLFPGIGEHHRDLGDFANTLSRKVEREIGADFNLHLVRHLTAYRILRRIPGAYELVSRVLGHSTTATTRHYYCGLEMIFAVREATRLLELDRVEIRPTTAYAAMARKRRRVRQRKTPKSAVVANKVSSDGL